MKIRSARGEQRRAATYQRLLSLVAHTIAYAEAALRFSTKYGFSCLMPAKKVVSLFEPHTDIICKGGRQTHYGHKINLSTGRSALVLDVVVEQPGR